MLRFTRQREQPLDATESRRALRLRLPYEERVKSRLATMTEAGEAVAIVLPRGSILRHGTVLAGDDDALALIEAAPQPVTRIRADSALSLLRAVYHLANRHVAAQLAADHAMIERDPVLEAMLQGLGARIEHIEAPFDPEGGAYSSESHHHGHAHCEEIDTVSATIGEQLSIAAHTRRKA
jgi:urease accessory protein